MLRIISYYQSQLKCFILRIKCQVPCDAARTEGKYCAWYQLSMQFTRTVTYLPCENVPSGICGQRRPRSACTSTQSYHGLHCPLTESLDTTECINSPESKGPDDTLHMRRMIWIRGPVQWLSGRASALWPVGCGFDPRPGHTKDFKNGTSCSFAWRSA